MSFVYDQITGLPESNAVWPARLADTIPEQVALWEMGLLKQVSSNLCNQSILVSTNYRNTS